MRRRSRPSSTAADLDPAILAAICFFQGLRQLSESGGRSNSELPALCGAPAGQRAGPVLLRHEFVEGKAAGRDQSSIFRTVESLLQKSIALDGTLADAHVQLGNLYADQHDYTKSIPEYVSGPGTESEPSRCPLSPWQ